MASGDLTTIRNALATRMSSIAVANPSVSISPYVLLNPVPPVIWVRPTTDVVVDYHEAFQNGYETWHMVVEAYAGDPTDPNAAQQLLDSFCAGSGSLSVKATIESDPTLGAAVQSAIVRDIYSYREFANPEGAWLIAASWTVDIVP